LGPLEFIFKLKYDEEKKQHGYELVKILTSEPFFIRVLKGEIISKEDVYAYTRLNKSSLELQQALKNQRTLEYVDPRIQQARYNLHKVRDLSTDGNTFSEHKQLFREVLDHTTEALQTASAKVPNINEYLLIADALKQ